MNAMTDLPRMIAFVLDGQPAEAFEGESILKAAERHGVSVPRLCFSDGLRPDGNCRACVVEVAGERTLSASCCRVVGAGLSVRTDTPRVQRAQRLVLELLRADVPAAKPGHALKHDSELDQIGRAHV